ncbi:hypothetical protein H634G_10396 [Metarhizium anisopliae BRIP 53293]|uniref:DUF6546 domain-containing protein n=1 Tax=Metarhizium anisopliae BRIP 53293 TaxID=1291518 RepID=A0A0D9NNQ8_METAN|nr:hypothetical protein H634G_10396 [Metarhizium anisopliae BRIP 53293]KJK91853.1 hypothetical protein H633G_04276 [Metarhizium anisopliae BRIP 53284]
MPATTSPTPRGISWQRFPAEIRTAILEALLQTRGRLGSLATVSREWQAIIEKHSFSRIKLTLARLAKFSSMMRRNRALVRYIYFCVELQAYDCSKCSPGLRDDTDGLCMEDNVRIVKGLEALFSTLSTWEPQRRGETLQLDISVYSPSDPEHWCKYLTFEPDLPFEECTIPSLVRSEYDDDKHGWRAGRQVQPPVFLAIQKVFDEIMEQGPFEDTTQDKEWYAQLPLAPAVTSLLLRQQSRRQWHPQALAWLLPRFPNLREFHYEPWREWYDGIQVVTDRESSRLFRVLASIQPQLRRLVVFENFVPEYTDDLLLCSRFRIPNPDLGHAVCSASLQLEELSASFIVEASHFFDCAGQHTSWVWANLTSVALTTRLLVPGANLTSIEDMLRDAAAAAMRMPKLENMEIWNGGKGSAMLSRYQQRRPHSQAVINWKGTWTRAMVSHLRPRVMDAWEAVARQQKSLALTMEEELRESDAADIKSHGDAIYYLDLSSPVVRPISLRQIRMEQIIREGGHG